MYYYTRMITLYKQKVGEYMEIQEVLMRLILASVLGGLIGLERQIKHHPAGLRTNTLVCIGAAVTMILAELLGVKQFESYGVISDPSRIAGQVISGIGFLGAGTIIHSNSHIKGLTTAASLWTVACIGLVAGSGYYLFAAAITAIVFIVLYTYGAIINKTIKNHQMHKVIIDFEPDVDIANNVLCTLDSFGVDINEVEVNIPIGDNLDIKIAEISFVPLNFTQLSQIVKSLDKIKGNVIIKI